MHLKVRQYIIHEKMYKRDPQIHICEWIRKRAQRGYK